MRICIGVERIECISLDGILQFGVICGKIPDLEIIRAKIVVLELARQLGKVSRDRQEYLRDLVDPRPSAFDTSAAPRRFAVACAQRFCAEFDRELALVEIGQDQTGSPA